MQLPVISTLIPGCIDSVMDGFTGTLVPAHSTPELITAIERYMNNPELGREHGFAGRKRVLLDFSQEEVWEGLFKEYVHLLSKKGMNVAVARQAK
jgi:glycosyltransferase involved in cell wall biosynthesis